MTDSRSQLFSLQSKNLFLSIQDFDVLDSIGQGAFSQVFLAIHKKTHKKYALKEFNINRMNQSAIQNIVKEIQIHSTIKHPDIVEFVDHFYSKNYFYIVLEYVKSENLYSFMRQRPQLDEKDVKFIFSKVLGGMKYLHSNGIVLRDLKPENVLISNDIKTIKICDFGWASFISDKQWLMKMAGTYSYMAPESLLSQMQGFETDIWALGIFLYELIHGKEPYPGNNPQSVLNKVRSSTINYDSNINENAKDLISKLLKKEKFSRLQINDIENHPYLQQNINQQNKDNDIKFDEQIFNKKTLDDDSELLSSNFDQKELKRTRKKNYNNNKSILNKGPRVSQSQVCIQRVNKSFEKDLKQKQNIKMLMREHSTNLIGNKADLNQNNFQAKVYYVNNQNNNIDLYSTQNLFAQMTHEQNTTSNNTSQRTVSIDRNITKNYTRNRNPNSNIIQEHLFQQFQSKVNGQQNDQRNYNSYKFYNNLSTEESINKMSFVSSEVQQQPQRRLTKQFQQKINIQQLSSRSIPVKPSKQNPLQARITLKKQKTQTPQILIQGQQIAYSTKQIKSAKNNNQKKQKNDNFYQGIISYNYDKDKSLLNPLGDFNHFSKRSAQKEFLGYPKQKNSNRQINKKKSLLAQALPLDTQKTSKYYKQKSRKNSNVQQNIIQNISSRWIDFQPKSQKSYKNIQIQFNYKQYYHAFSQLYYIRLIFKAVILLIILFLDFMFQVKYNVSFFIKFKSKKTLFSKNYPIVFKYIDFVSNDNFKFQICSKKHQISFNNCFIAYYESFCIVKINFVIQKSYISTMFLLFIFQNNILNSLIIYISLFFLFYKFCIFIIYQKISKFILSKLILLRYRYTKPSNFQLNKGVFYTLLYIIVSTKLKNSF